MVVTVPGLGTPTGGDEAGVTPTVSASSPSGSRGAAGTVTVTATASDPGTASGAADSTGATAPPGRATQTTPAAPTTAPRTPTARTTPSRTTAPRTTSAHASTSAGGGTVDLSGCAGCTVIATHAGVSGSLGVALATNPRGAVLLSVRSGGAIAGVINVPYGATFPTPSGKSLPCDSSGRCFVTGRQADGNAILSAFKLTSDGAWQDVSGDGGFPSATARGLATDVDGDGQLDVAVQESGGGQTTWMVLTWSGEHFSVLGCAPASDVVPSAGELSPDSCLS